MFVLTKVPNGKKDVVKCHQKNVEEEIGHRQI